MRRDTGLPQVDAADDFQRARRRRILARLRRLFTRGPTGADPMLPFDEVVNALGRKGEHYIGQQRILLSSIVGSVDKPDDFDRKLRPRSNRTRNRWERVGEAQRRGHPMPPIDVYRIGGLHFVRDGHNRVSVTASLGFDTIEANVTEIVTKRSPDELRRHVEKR